MGSGTVLIYCPIITALSGRTGGNERGRDETTGRKGGGRDKQSDREKRGINQQGRRMRERERERESKATVKR